MAQLDRLVQRIRARHREADFNDARRLLEAYGRIFTRQKGSHVHFTKAGERIQTVPLVSGRYVKRYILDQIIDRLELDE